MSTEVLAQDQLKFIAEARRLLALMQDPVWSVKRLIDDILRDTAMPISWGRKLNRSRGVQSFGIKGSHGIRAGSGRMGSTHLVRGIRSFRSAPEPVTQEHTVHSVFGKRS